MYSSSTGACFHGSLSLKCLAGKQFLLRSVWKQRQKTVMCSTEYLGSSKNLTFQMMLSSH